MENLLDIYTNPDNNILQSEKWARFYEALGHKTWFISGDEDKCLIIKMPLYKEKAYLYVPRGPQCSSQGWHVFLIKAKAIAKNENCVFIRVEPVSYTHLTLPTTERV